MEKRAQYSTATLFREVIESLRSKNKLWDGIEYTLPTRNPVQILNDEFECTGTVSFGGSEGIYLDLCINGEITSMRDTAKFQLGTIKTLQDGYDAYKQMCIMTADFVFELRDFVDSHYNDFRWSGYDVRCYKNGKTNCGICTATKDRAEKYAINMLANGAYEKVVVMNNATGKTSEFVKEDK